MQMSLSVRFKNEGERKNDLQWDFMLSKTSLIWFWENLPQWLGVCAWVEWGFFTLVGGFRPLYGNPSSDAIDIKIDAIDIMIIEAWLSGFQ